MRLSKLALVPVAVLMASVFVTLFFDFSEMFVLNPPHLLLTLNIIFWTIATAAIAYISARSYIKDGSLTVLLLSSSILIFGISVIISGWVGEFSGNLSVAVSNPCLLVASLLQVMSGILSFEDRQETKTSNRKGLLATAYFASVIFVVAYSAVVWLGYMPAFFTALGPTLLRQAVLGSAVILFMVAAIIFGVQYLKSKSPSLFWYALAIALLSIGLFSAFEVKTLGDVPTWLGRATLYVGTSYLVAALLASRQKTDTGTDVAGAWSEAFRSDRVQIATLFSKMLDAFVYGKAVIDKNGEPVDCIFLEVNSAFEQITGIKREKVIGKKVTEIVPGVQNDPAGWISIYGRVALTGESVQFENYLEPLKKWYHVSAYSPKKGYFAAIFEDITQRKKAEEALAFSSSLAENLSEAVISTDLDYKIRTWNKAAEEIYGFKAAEVIGRVVRDVLKTVVPDDSIRQAALKLFEAGFWHGEAIQFRKDGTYVNILSSVSLLKDKDGKPFAIVAVNRDITRRKRNEEALSKQAALIDLSPNGIIVRKVDGTITFWSHGAEILYGWTKDEAIGQLTDRLLETKFPIPLEEIIVQMRSIGRWSGEVVHQTKDGREIAVQSWWLGRFGDNGELAEILESNVDITENKQMQTKLEEYSRHLEKLVEERTKQLRDSERLAAIGATAGMVGHDIRNPLQAITSDVYLAKSDLASMPESEEKKDIQESLDEIEKNVYYINKIVADLQDFARPITPVTKETNLQKLIDELLAKNGVPKKVKVQVKVHKETSTIMADSDILKRILGNLVTNAVQAMPEGGKLSITSYREANDVVITVADTGVGIPEEAKPKLFTPLFTTKSKGQGFGLSVVKRMTEALNGTVTFESQEGKGTKFIIRLPAQQNKQ